MKKNPFKSFIKSIVRTLWKYFLDPVFINLLPKSKPKDKLKNIGYRIEHRAWWPKTPKALAITYVNSKDINAYLLSELSELGKIEFGLQPSQSFLSAITTYQYNPPQYVEPNSLGAIYGLILRNFNLNSLNFDVAFLAPWLKRGGSDLGLLHHINVMHNKGYKTLLITTEYATSPWIDRLPLSTTHLDIGKFAKQLSLDKKAELLTRILLQSSCQTIHNINSELGWEVYQRFGKQLKSMHKNLFASIFCEDETNEPNIFFGYAPKYLAETHAVLDGILCDTTSYAKIQQSITGLSQLFHTVYFPFLGKLNQYNAVSNAPILWASRFTKQKRPNLLYQIAKAMPEYQFHIYGELDLDYQKILEKLKTLPNVTYFGKYDSFTSITNKQQYSCFLYTSQYDGLPNVLIEAISNGLPVISYDVGGINELISPDCLLNDSNDLSVNISNIKTIISDSDKLFSSWQYSLNLLQSRHNWEKFISSLEVIENYFPKLSQQAYKTKYYENLRILSKPNNQSHTTTNE